MDKIAQLSVMARKELTSCLRDSDVLLYSILMPCVFWPLLVVAVSEYFIWQSGAQEHLQVRVAYAGAGNPLVKEVAERFQTFEKFKTVAADDPMQALRSGEADLVVAPAADGRSVHVRMRSSQSNYELIRGRIEQSLRALQDKNLSESLKAHNKAGRFVDVFAVRTEDVAPGVGPPQTRAPAGVLRIGSLLLLALSLTSVAYGVMAPAVSIFTDEREKSTIATTLLLPTSRAVVVTAKILAIALVGTVAGVANIVSAALATFAIVAQLGLLSKLNLAGAALQTFSWTTLALLILLIGFYSLSTAALLSLLGSRMKDYSQAYNAISIPVVWCGVSPFVSLLPMLHLDGITSCIPFVNISLLIKDLLTSEPAPGPAAMACLLMIVLDGICLYFITSFVNSEKILVDHS